MKMIKNGIMIAAFLLIVPMVLTAMGNSEKAYGEVLDEEFTAIVEALEAGDLDMKTAVEQLHDLRTENDRENIDDYQIMEKLMAEVQNREMTATQARVQFCELSESETDLTELQLRTRTRTMDQIRIQDASGDQVREGESGSGNGSGSGTGKDTSGQPDKGTPEKAGGSADNSNGKN
ncbi:MAG: hypothetical protein JEZ04_09715 [Spirochaetales bacterium]|nr:hypothetical protein [Spirochaetales bacterium]